MGRHEVSPAEAALAYALFDAENTTRLGEQPVAVFKQYATRARVLLSAITTYQTDEARRAIARAVTAGLPYK